MPKNNGKKVDTPPPPPEPSPRPSQRLTRYGNPPPPRSHRGWWGSRTELKCPAGHDLSFTRAHMMCGLCAELGRVLQARSSAGLYMGLPPLCDIPSGCCSFTGPWTVTRSSLCMLRRVAAFCRPLRPVLLLVSSPRSRSPVVGVLGLC